MTFPGHLAAPGSAGAVWITPAWAGGKNSRMTKELPKPAIKARSKSPHCANVNPCLRLVIGELPIEPRENELREN